MGVLALYPIAGMEFYRASTVGDTANIDPKVAALVGLALVA